jgi:RNA-directed DNA polymerase
LFDPGFADSSFGFRPGRFAHGALMRVQSDLVEGYRVGVDLVLAKFFDHVQHDVLMARVGRKVRVKRLLILVKSPKSRREGHGQRHALSDRQAAGNDDRAQ